MPAPRDCQIGGYANFFEENAHLDEWSISMNESSTGKGDAAPTGMVVREDLDAARYAEAAQVLLRALAACCAVAWAGAPQLSIWQATDSCFLTAHLPFPTSPPACAKHAVALRAGANQVRWWWGDAAGSIPVSSPRFVLGSRVVSVFSHPKIHRAKPTDHV